MLGEIVADRYEIVRVETPAPFYQAFSARERGPGNGREVLLWIVHPDLVPRPEARQKFVGMARSAAGADAAHQQRILDAGVDPRLGVYVVLAPAIGQTLAERIARGKPAPEPVVAFLAQGLAQALDSVHHNGLIHGFLRAGDIVMAGEWPRVSGMGLWPAIDRGAALAYMKSEAHLLAPEVRTGEAPSRRSDVYAMAVILTEVALGQGAESPAEAAVLRDQLRRDRPRLEQALRAALATNPVDRPASAGRLAADLRALVPPARVRRPTLADVRAGGPVGSSAGGGGVAVTMEASPEAVPEMAFDKVVDFATVPAEEARQRRLASGTTPPPETVAGRLAVANPLLRGGTPTPATRASMTTSSGRSTPPPVPSSAPRTSGPSRTGVASRTSLPSRGVAGTPAPLSTLPGLAPAPSSPRLGKGSVDSAVPEPIQARRSAERPAMLSDVADDVHSPYAEAEVIVGQSAVTPLPAPLPERPALARSSASRAVAEPPHLALGSVERPAVDLTTASPSDETVQIFAAPPAEEPEWASLPTKKAPMPMLPRPISEGPLGKQRASDDAEQAEKTPLPLPPPEDVTNVKRAPVRQAATQTASFRSVVVPPVAQLPVVSHRPLSPTVHPPGEAFAERALASQRRSSALVITLVSTLFAGVIFGGFAWWWQEQNAEVAAADEAVSRARQPREPLPVPPAPEDSPPAGPARKKSAAAAAPVPDKSWACPAGMVLVELRSIRFCIDRDEAAQKTGAPHAGVPFEYAAEACKAAGKRLCAAKEWELACRGDHLSSYPWGGKPAGDDGPCNLGPDRQIDSAGSHEACVSASGARDMAGNVAEWDADGQLRGGSARSTGDGRCSRPMLKKEGRTLEDVGYRCCADLGAP